jgi:hypothetical protein
MIVNLRLLIFKTNNLSIINNPKGTMLTMNNISRIILYADPVLGGLNSLYTVKNAT